MARFEWVTAHALELGAPFVDGAVLQREMSVPVWGWAEPGAKVTARFAEQTKTATAGPDGKWMLALDPLVSSFEPGELVVSDSAGGSVTVGNILVGEVWMASGQSNMQWQTGKSDVGRALMKQIAARVAAGEERAPVIREAKVTDVFASLHPIERAQVQWSDEAEEFSAIAFAFAYELHRELGVPIGILNCSFSQTAIQAWVPRVGFRDGEDAYTQAIYQKILQTDPTTPEHQAAWDQFYLDIETTLKDNAQRVARGEEPLAISTKTPGNLNGNRDATWLYNARIHPVVPFAIRGAIWNQGYANMNEGLPYYHNLHSLVRGWRLMWNRPDLPVYFHQFYTPGGSPDDKDLPQPSLNSTGEMRLGTWLARDIPNTGMASQIDIGGSIHYPNKALPGRRLAWQALKHQYPDTQLSTGIKAADLVADGPMFKAYSVEGDKLIVEFDHAEGGLVVAETHSDSAKGIAWPTIIPDGADRVDLFYLADENRVWHPAKLRIDGSRVVLSSPKVRSPRGVAYGTQGIGFRPNLYNQALLPMTPFIYYDHELVTSETWTHGPLKVDGVEIDPSTQGKLAEYRKMPLLSTQFRDNAVLQAGMPVTIWGSAIHDWGYEAKGEAVITFRFAGVEKTIPVTPGMREWQVTLPPMEASAEPKTLHVTFTIDGELAHERVYENIVIGEVWYVAAPPIDFVLPAQEPATDQAVRMLTRKAKRSSHGNPSRFSISVSTNPEDNRFASEWEPASGFAAALGQRIAAKTGKPVGIVFMQVPGGKDTIEPQLKSWIAAEDLELAPSLADDYRQLASLRPGNEHYDANARRYIDAWKSYWRDEISTLMRTKAAPQGNGWGSYPALAAQVKTNASETYNVLVHSLTPGSFRGVVFLTSPVMFEADQGRYFGEQLAALANGWKKRFACEDPIFLYTLPSASLVPDLKKPPTIDGRSAAIEIDAWLSPKATETQTLALIEAILANAYP